MAWTLVGRRSWWLILARGSERLSKMACTWVRPQTPGMALLTCVTYIMAWNPESGTSQMGLNLPQSILPTMGPQTWHCWALVSPILKSEIIIVSASQGRRLVTTVGTEWGLNKRWSLWQWWFNQGDGGAACRLEGQWGQGGRQGTGYYEWEQQLWFFPVAIRRPWRGGSERLGGHSEVPEAMGGHQNVVFRDITWLQQGTSWVRTGFSVQGGQPRGAMMGDTVA